MRTYLALCALLRWLRDCLVSDVPPADTHEPLYLRCPIRAAEAYIADGKRMSAGQDGAFRHPVKPTGARG